MELAWERCVINRASPSICEPIMIFLEDFCFNLHLLQGYSVTVSYAPEHFNVLEEEHKLLTSLKSK